MLKIKKNYNFIEVLNLWLKTKTEIKVQTYQKYELLICTYIEQEIGYIRLKKIRTEDIERFFQRLREQKLAISTQKTLYYIIKSCLKFAYDNKMCTYIDLKNIKFKSNVAKRIRIFSKEEQLRIEQELNYNMNIRKLCMLLCLYTGIRLGEVSGLKWEDINFEQKSLSVKRTIQRIKNDSGFGRKTVLIESTPKTETSFRVVPVPDFIIELLRQYRKEDINFILSGRKKLYDPRQFEAFYGRFLKKCGITHAKFHTLRHTFATRCIESKMDIKTLSEILGHSSVEITLKLYVHPSYDLKKVSIENLVKFMSITNI